MSGPSDSFSDGAGSGRLLKRAAPVLAEGHTTPLLDVDQERRTDERTRATGTTSGRAMGNDPLRPRQQPTHIPALPDPLGGGGAFLPGRFGRGADAAHAVMRRRRSGRARLGNAGGSLAVRCPTRLTARVRRESRLVAHLSSGARHLSVRALPYTSAGPFLTWYARRAHPVLCPLSTC